MYDEESFIELEKPFLKDCQITMAHDCHDVTASWGMYKNFMPGLIEQEVNFRFACDKVNIVPSNTAKGWFEKLSEELSVKELMGIVKNKLMERKHGKR
ncbi:TPA: hypothetical protein DIC62_00615 [Candidatus Nomurabacteria bacterium]|nr:hypothetical protein [Candidatus Nomurabacteria bacterium]